jgi:ribosome recycling factor
MFLVFSDPPSFSQVDELTKKFVKSAEDMCKAKEKEITGG